MIRISLLLGVCWASLSFALASATSLGLGAFWAVALAAAPLDLAVFRRAGRRTFGSEWASTHRAASRRRRPRSNALRNPSALLPSEEHWAFMQSRTPETRVGRRPLLEVLVALGDTPNFSIDEVRADLALVVYRDEDRESAVWVPVSPRNETLVIRRLNDWVRQVTHDPDQFSAAELAALSQAATSAQWTSSLSSALRLQVAAMRHSSRASALRRVDLRTASGWLELKARLEDSVDPNAGPFGELTSREQAVLELLARGATSREIAEQLSISPDLVRTFIGRVHLKLDTEGVLLAPSSPIEDQP